MNIHEIGSFRLPGVQGLPLLILACSKTKNNFDEAPALSWRRFHELYAGPLWEDVKRSGFPLGNVAALSALHGYLEPGWPIRPYDHEMDIDQSRNFQRTGCHRSRLAKDADAHGRVFVVGGRDYRAIAEAAELLMHPGTKVEYATGSYLAQRKQLNAWLRSHAQDVAFEASLSELTGPVVTKTYWSPFGPAPIDNDFAEFRT